MNQPSKDDSKQANPFEFATTKLAGDALRKISEDDTEVRDAFRHPPAIRMCVSAIRHYKETSILKPVSLSTHSDDWPCFLLSDATVHHRDGTMANQLNVDLEGPFIIRGRLELEKDNERYRMPL